MDENAYSDGEDTARPDSYWRRRVITLVAGLGLLSVLAWAFSGGGGKPPNPAPKASQTTNILPAAAYSGVPSSPAVSPAASGLAGRAIPGVPTASASASGTPAPASSRPARGPAGRKQTRTSERGKSGTGTVPAVTTGSGREPDGDCSPNAVVLSLFTSKPDYVGGQDPEFGLYAVSTGAESCAFATGPGQLDVVVMSEGRVIWDSSDCRKGESSRAVELSRGVPVQQTVTWNRSITLPGCITLASSARAGSYQVEARTASVSSPVRTFKLER